MSKLTKEQIKRYNRQVIVPSFGVDSQLKLLQSKVIVIGVGGLGCPVSSNLAASGIGRCLLI